MSTAHATVANVHRPSTCSSTARSPACERGSQCAGGDDRATRRWLPRHHPNVALKLTHRQQSGWDRADDANEVREQTRVHSLLSPQFDDAYTPPRSELLAVGAHTFVDDQEHVVALSDDPRREFDHLTLRTASVQGGDVDQQPRSPTPHQKLLVESEVYRGHVHCRQRDRRDRSHSPRPICSRRPLSPRASAIAPATLSAVAAVVMSPLTPWSTASGSEPTGVTMTGSAVRERQRHHATLTCVPVGDQRHAHPCEQAPGQGIVVDEALSATRNSSLGDARRGT